MKAMRLLHAIASMSSSSGGPSAAVLNMVRALSAREHHCDIVTTDDDGPNRRLPVALGSWNDMPGGRIRHHRRQFVHYTTSFGLGAWLRNGVRDYDLVHAHGLFSFAPVVAALAARHHAIPYVFSPHGVLNRWGLEHRRPLAKRVSIAMLEGPLLRRAAGVHFTSATEQEQALRLGIPLRSAVVMLGMPFEGMDLEPAAGSAMRENGAAHPREPAILFLSRLHAIKRLDLLIESFSQVVRERPETRLWVAGDGPAELVATLRSQAEALGIEESIAWFGHVQGDAKTDLLHRARMLIMPSYSENFGVAAAEAMAAGIPVIVSEGVGIAPLVRESGAGFVFDGTSRGLVPLLRQLLSDDALHARMACAARKAVRNELSLDTFGRHLEDMYRSFVADQPAIVAPP